MLEAAPRLVAHPGLARARRRPKLDPLPYLLVAPAVLLVLGVAVYPALYAIQLSTTDANLLKLAAQENIGVRNYQKAFADAILQGATVGTIRWVVTVSTVQMAIALPVALFLNVNFRARGLVRAAIVVPWVVSPAVVAILWRFMVDGNFGVINDILVKLGIIAAYVPWLSELFNTYLGLILAESTHALPFAIWMLTNYFASLPRELEEAAQVDGCTRVGALVRVVVPLAVPGIVAAALFVFIASWNELLFAFMFTSGEDVRTLPVLLRGFIPSETGVSWGIVTAGAVTATLPVAAAFLVFQRYLVRGLASGAVKG